jgi:hypothetical protein
MKLFKGLLVPGIVAVYIILFWKNTSGMSLSGAGVPRLLIICLGVLIVMTTVSEFKAARTTPGEKPAVGDDAAGSPAVGNDSVAHEAAGHEVDPVPETSARASNYAEDLSLGEEGLSGGPGLWRPAVVLLFLVGYWQLLARIGVYPATALFAVCLTLFLGCRRPFLIGLVAVIAVLVSFGFVQLFTLPLPGIAGVDL